MVRLRTFTKHISISIKKNTRSQLTKNIGILASKHFAAAAERNQKNEREHFSDRRTAMPAAGHPMSILSAVCSIARANKQKNSKHRNGITPPKRRLMWVVGWEISRSASAHQCNKQIYTTHSSACKQHKHAQGEAKTEHKCSNICSRNGHNAKNQTITEWCVCMCACVVCAGPD